MEQENKNLMGPVLILLTGVTVFIFYHWITYTEIYLPKSPLLLSLAIKVLNPELKVVYAIVLYYILLWCLFLLFPSVKLGRNMTDKVKYSYITLSVCLFLLSCVNYIEVFVWDVIIYPLLILATIPVTVRAAASLRKQNKEDTFFNEVSCLKSDNDFSFEFNTKEGLLRIHKPEENIFIDGGPGSGKSHYLIKFIIQQSAFKKYAGVIYDYEGDPTKEGLPILSNIAYSSIMAAKKSDPEHNLKFGFINFTDMTKTLRINILSRNYFNEDNAQLFIDNIATCLMKNLEPAWKEKTDFWAGNAINYVSSIMYMLYKNYSHKGFNTLPHAIAVCLYDSNTVFRFLEQDKEISRNMAPMITAWKLGAHQQTAGAVSSAQLPLKLLNRKEIFWVLSKDEFSLDITNAENPVLLCIGSAPDMPHAVNPAISSIFTVIQTQMNSPGKCKSIFCVDELPRVNLYGLDGFIATARKHNISTILAVQDFSQLVRDYGDKSASTIKASCGTRFQGKTGNAKTCEEIVKILGETKRSHISFSEQSSGSHSVSESLQREKILQERDIASQNSGHFFGIISNGNPPFLFTDFEPFHKTGLKKYEIPPFACKTKTGDPEMDKKILYTHVKSNFEKIHDEIDELLAPFNALNENEDDDE